jgi:hypothetical protein
MNNPERKIKVHRGQIGPNHDPYDETTIEVTLGNKTAMFTRDGLGCTCLKLLVGNTEVDVKAWADTTNATRDKTMIDGFRRSFEAHVGIRPEQALEEWECSWEPDLITGGGP